MSDIITQLKALKLHGMADCYVELESQGAYSHLKEPPIITQKGHLKLRKAATEI